MLATNTILLFTINNLSPQTTIRFVINYVVNLVLFFSTFPALHVFKRPHEASYSISFLTSLLKPFRFCCFFF